MGLGAAPIRDGTLDVTDVAVVGIADDGSGATCTGALIAPDLVLTAQHCVAPVMDVGPCTQGTFGAPVAAARFHVTTRPALTANPGDYRGVAELILPPGGPGFCGRDLALMRLASAVPASEAAPIAPRLTAAAVGERYSAVGYGATDDDGTGAGERRRRDGLVVECVGDGCASTSVGLAEWRGDAGPCQGDSGGPALDGSGAVFGVVSRGAFGCVAPTHTSVAAHGDWLIAEAIRIADLGGYPPPAWTGVVPATDAGLDATLDATGDVAEEPGGCCQSGGAAGGPLALALLTALALRAARRRPT